MIARAPYMEWAKSRPKPGIDLAGSNLLACILEDLPGARDAVDVAGDSPDGYPPLLEAIANRHGTTRDHVACAVGCSGANFLAFAAVLETGDEVLCESPGYDPLPAAARMLGARTRTFPRRFEEGYEPDPDAIAASASPATRMILLSNPHNPSGALASEERLRALAAFAEKRGIILLVDEVYLDTVDPPAVTASRLSPQVIASNSLTKSYGLASLRCGWTLASPELTARIRRVRDVVDGWSPIPADRLSVLAFAHLERLAARARAIIRPNRQRVAAWMKARADLEWVESRATIAFPRLRGIRDCGSFAERLLSETGTAVAPGRFFDAPEHFRIAFGGEPACLAEGLEAIGRTLDAMRAPRS